MVCSQSFGNSKVTTYMIDFVKNNSNDKLHVSSKRKESLSQDIKYEVYFGDESNYYYCSCGSFHKERVVCCYQVLTISLIYIDVIHSPS